MSSKWGVAPVLSILSLLIGTWSTVYPSLLIMLKFYPNKGPIIDSLTWTLIEILQVVQIEYYSSFQKKKEKRKREKSITVALWNLFIVIQPQVIMCYVSHVLQYISFRNIPNEEDLLILFWLLYIISHFSVAYTKISNSRDLAIYMVWDTLQFYDIFDLQRIVRNYKMFKDANWNWCLLVELQIRETIFEGFSWNDVSWIISSIVPFTCGSSKWVSHLLM